MRNKLAVRFSYCQSLHIDESYRKNGSQGLFFLTNHGEIKQILACTNHFLKFYMMMLRNHSNDKNYQINFVESKTRFGEPKFCPRSRAHSKLPDL